MKKCVRITFAVSDGESTLESIKRKARSLNIEGIAYHLSGQEYEAIIHGEKEAVEKCIDALHGIVLQAGSEEFHVEPHPKEEDYRGVFRVLQ